MTLAELRGLRKAYDRRVSRESASFVRQTNMAISAAMSGDVAKDVERLCKTWDGL